MSWIEPTSQVIANSATTLSLAAIAFLYRRDRADAARQRQVEVHAHATEQWRDLVKLSLEHQDLQQLVLRGFKVETKRDHLFFELVAILMAYIFLLDSREETTVAGSTWVEGWQTLFVDLLADSQFRSFIEKMQPFYDKAFCTWLDALIERSLIEPAR